MSYSTKIKFTKSSLTSLKKASNCNRYFVYDTVVRGFCLMVTQTGYKSFYLNRTINDRSVRIYIGPFPDIPVEMARKKAEEFAAQVALGNDPQDARRAKRAELTLGEFNEKYLAHWANRRLSTFTRDDIATLHSGVVEGFNTKTKLTIRKAYGFRTYHGAEVALYHTLGKLPEPDFTHEFC